MFFSLSAKIVRLVWFYATTLWAWAITQPLYYIYRHGPRIASFGFWYGADNMSLCSHLVPNINAAHWQQHPEVCMDIITRHFHSIVIGLLLLTLVICATSLFFCFLLRQCCMRPVIRGFQGVQSTLKKQKV